MEKSIFEKVKEFADRDAKDKPIVITRNRLLFIVRMVLSEFLEMIKPVNNDAFSVIIEAVSNLDVPKDVEPNSMLIIIKEMIKMNKLKETSIPKGAFSLILEALTCLDEQKDEVSSSMLIIIKELMKMNKSKSSDTSKVDNSLPTKQILCEQADAMVDIIYYILCFAAGEGYNLKEPFNLVHNANMTKIFPDGEFHYREEDGKKIKPPGFIDPDIMPAIEKMISNGSWN